MANTLAKELQQFVDHEFASGRYQSTDDVIIAGLRLLQRDRQAAVEGIKEGLAKMERGEGDGGGVGVCVPSRYCNRLLARQ